MRWLAVLALAACGGRIDVDPVAATPEQPTADPCGLRALVADECTEETLNDGGGPDARRRVCHAGGDTWIQYPSGEQWWTRERDGGVPEVLCHGAPDGGILWQVDAP